ncbi:nuclease-related domain-containing protein [Shewanella mangrovisoli]|uniref:Nuclease-related domain-containing protein n=1 Tax=Shewanella mangrovisoli TaxID=2864211 RepID=A0ABV4VFQ4_9GAMM
MKGCVKNIRHNAKFCMLLAVMVSAFGVGLYPFSLKALEKQDSEAICILIQSEMQDWHPTTPRYQELKARFDERCQHPVANGVKSTVKQPATPTTVRQDTPKQKPNIIPAVVTPKSTPAASTISRISSVLESLSILLVIPIFILVSAIVSLLFRPTLRQYRAERLGQQGEKRVAKLLKQGFKDEDFRLYRNLILPMDEITEGTSALTEVDLVLLTHFGVFVIEVKNYSGWIFGGEKQALWTQKIFTKQTRFKNPLHQNYKHCLAVAHCLGLVEGLHSVVVFSDEASFKTPLPKNVVNESGLLSLIAQYKGQISETSHNLAFTRAAERLDIAQQQSDSDAKSLHLMQFKHRRVEPTITS